VCLKLRLRGGFIQVDLVGCVQAKVEVIYQSLYDIDRVLGQVEFALFL
jgi:hypothetical protein